MARHRQMAEITQYPGSTSWFTVCSMHVLPGRSYTACVNVFLTSICLVETSSLAGTASRVMNVLEARL